MIGYIALAVLAIALLLVSVANSRWAAGKGWVYNKHNPRPSGRGIPPGAFDQIFQPSVEHVVEEQSSERARGDHAKPGDKPSFD